MNINPIFLKDFYKVGHINQYPDGTVLYLKMKWILNLMMDLGI